MPRAALYDIAEAADTKDAIMKAVGDLSCVQHLFSARILVAMYIRPTKTKGGIYITDKEKNEDVYQGRVGLVLKKGPRAFQDDEANTFHGQNVEIGQWVAFRPGDGKRIQINGVDCRIIEDTLVDMILDDPSIITHRQ